MINKSSRKECAERLKKTFPMELEREVDNVIKIMPIDHRIGETLIHPSEYEVKLGSEKLIIPYRVYFEEPTEDDEKKLSEIEYEILNCIYLRHHDGFVREERLKNLLNSKSKFVIPFSLQLLGEYVIEIMEILNKHIAGANLTLYQEFAKENPKFWSLTKSRVISYWDAYYKHKSPQLKDYIGTQLVKKINP